MISKILCNNNCKPIMCPPDPALCRADELYQYLKVGNDIIEYYLVISGHIFDLSHGFI